MRLERQMCMTVNGPECSQPVLLSIWNKENTGSSDSFTMSRRESKEWIEASAKATKHETKQMDTSLRNFAKAHASRNSTVEARLEDDSENSWKEENEERFNAAGNSSWSSSGLDSPSLGPFRKLLLAKVSDAELQEPTHFTIKQGLYAPNVVGGEISEAFEEQERLLNNAAVVETNETPPRIRKWKSFFEEDDDDDDLQAELQRLTFSSRFLNLELDTAEISDEWADGAAWTSCPDLANAPGNRGPNAWPKNILGFFSEQSRFQTPSKASTAEKESAKKSGMGMDDEGDDCSSSAAGSPSSVGQDEHKVGLARLIADLIRLSNPNQNKEKLDLEINEQRNLLKKNVRNMDPDLFQAAMDSQKQKQDSFINEVRQKLRRRRRNQRLQIRKRSSSEDIVSGKKQGIELPGASMALEEEKKRTKELIKQKLREMALDLEEAMERNDKKQAFLVNKVKEDLDRGVHNRQALEAEKRKTKNLIKEKLREIASDLDETMDKDEKIQAFLVHKVKEDLDRKNASSMDLCTPQ